MDPQEPMDESQSQPEEIGLAEILCAAFFLLCLLLSFGFGYLFVHTGMFAALAAGKAGSEGAGLLILLLLAVSIPAFVTACVLSGLARHLPWWFRIIAALLPLAGIVLALAMCVAFE